MPVPGQTEAAANVLAGKTCVLTGVFPEVGGGAGLNRGKDRLKPVDLHAQCSSAVFPIALGFFFFSWTYPDNSQASQ